MKPGISGLELDSLVIGNESLFVTFQLVEHAAFFIPGISKERVCLDSQIIEHQGIVIAFEFSENFTFVVVGICVMGIKLDGVVIGGESFIIALLPIICISLIEPMFLRGRWESKGSWLVMLTFLLCHSMPPRKTLEMSSSGYI